MSNAVKAREIFFDAIEKDNLKAMQECIDVACRDDEELRLQVERLLQSHQKAGEFLGGDPAIDPTTIIPAITEQPGDDVGPYRLLQQIGEGGFGVVYMAEQTAPVRRKVALKIIKPGMDTKEVVARFEVERQALALMDHPNIAKVLDAGSTDSGRPYFVMELVRGIPITDYCGQEKIAVNERLDLFIKVCQAIQHAHQKGLIHRDIKPSNILVTMHDGIPVPKVIDFGIAKATQQLTEKTLFTQFHQFIGTPAYMSPEQAELSGLDIDTRSDVYSLGVLLYELLTGATPFDAQELLQSGLDAMRKIIREREPLRPSSRLSQTLSKASPSDAQDVAKLPRHIESDLDWIVMKCLEKDRARRYETANGLAMDLRRFLTQEPIVARPPSTLYRIRQAWRRNRVIYSAGCIVAASLVLGIVASSVAMREARIAEEKARQAQLGEQKRAQEADEARRQAEASARERQSALEIARVQELAARRHAYAGDMNVAKQAIEQGNFGRAADLLDRNRPQGPQQDLRGWEWRYLWQFCRSDAMEELFQAKRGVQSLDVSSDGQLAVASFRPAGVTLVDLDSKRVASVPATADLFVREVLFHPQEPRLVVSGWNANDRTNELRMVDLTTGREQWSILTERGWHNNLKFAGEPLRLVSVLGDAREIRVTDPASSDELASYPLEGPFDHDTLRIFHNFAVSPDGKQCVYSFQSGVVEAMDLSTGGILWKHESGNTRANLAYSNDGRMVAVGRREVVLLDSESGKELPSSFDGHEALVDRILFLDNDQTLVTSSVDQSIRVWDVSSGEELNRLVGARNEHWELKAIPGTSQLVSGGKDGKVILWNRKVDPHPRGLREIPDSGITDCRPLPGGSAIRTLHESGHVKEWRAPRFDTPSTLLKLPDGSEVFPTLSPDGNLIAAFDDEHGLHAWDVSEQRRIAWRRAYKGKLRDAWFGSQRLLFANTHESIMALDPLTGERAEPMHRVGQSSATPPPVGRIESYARSPSSGAFVFMVRGSLGNDHRPLIRLLDLSTMKEWEQRLEAHSAWPGSAISWDDRLIGIPTEPGEAIVLTIPDLAVSKTFGGHLTGVKGVGFSPDGSRCVTADAVGEMKLFDLQGGDELMTMNTGRQGTVNQRIRFSADGSLLALQGRGRVTVWRAPTWDEIDRAEEIRHVASP